MKHFLLSLLLFVVATFSMNASTKISVLTTFPCDKEVYTVWGHTAVLVNTGDGFTVYNYGVFDFSDDFVYTFVSGQTDYCLDTDEMGATLQEIFWKDSYAYVQDLNLTDEEAERVRLALEENLKPENRVYRYKFFSDNCATRPRRLFERCVAGISYAPVNNQNSYRDNIHELCSNMPWLRVGIDFCLGSDADKAIPDSMVTYLPTALLTCLDSARISAPDGSVRPLVSRKNALWKPQRASFHEENFVTTPMFPCLMVLAVSLLAFALVVWRSSAAFARIWGSLFFLVVGLMGALLFFLIFISTHECTSPNFNLMWANPIHLVVAGVLALGAKNKFAETTILVDAGFCLLYLFLIALLPQSSCWEFILVTLALIVSEIAYLWKIDSGIFGFLNKKSLSDKQPIK